MAERIVGAVTVPTQGFYTAINTSGAMASSHTHSPASYVSAVTATSGT